MPDFTTYQPPGVYVTEEQTPLVSVTGVTPTVVALVGPSVGYRKNTEAVTLSGVGPVTLAKTGINPTTEFEVRAADGTLYPAGAYSLTVAAGADGNITATGDNVTTLARNGIGIPDGTVVYVTYRYTDSDYFAPLRVTDFDDVTDFFGPSIDLVTNAIVSPLSLAAKIAFENGAGTLVLVPTTGTATATTRAELSAAYAKLQAQYDVNIVVPLAVGITGTAAAPGDVANVGTDLRTYVESDSAQGLFKIGIVGNESTSTVDPVTALASYRSKRIIAAYPNRLAYYNGGSNTTLELAGYYLAAAYAGRFASLPVQMPLTKKDIRGFAGLPASVLNSMSTTQKNTLSDQGLAVTEVTRAGALSVRHGTTTDRSNVNTREASLVRARDALVNLIQMTLDASELIGSYIEADTPVRVQGVITGVLETALNADVIVGYNDVKVRQVAGQPSVIEVKFQYQPAYPLNYIVVSFSINTETGETTALGLAA